MRTLSRRSRTAGRAAVVLLVTLVAAGYATAASDESPVVGRFSIISDVGGSVWAFGPGGDLRVIGPGDLVSQGTWLEGPEHGEFDASLAVEVSGQELAVLGAVSPDGRRVALYVRATEATLPGNWDAWPPESRLLGELLSVTGDEAPSPSPEPMDCLRPTWSSGTVVDWDRCGEDDEPSAAPVGAGQPAG